MIKLLLVDDEKGITDSLKDFFMHRGFTVYTADNGEKAIESVKKNKPDIVFLDIRMRGMSGLDTLEKIKKIDNKIKVIMLTILEEKKIIDKAMSLGADEYITKPFRIDYLEEVVIKKIQELTKGESNE
ncbi:MAG: response regulator [Candidatus Omnitrophica bacterium]|nr:response regulator [Candidatus Omnitrophota bacterium]